MTNTPGTQENPRDAQLAGDDITRVNESPIYSKENSMYLDSTRNPYVPSIFVRQMDSSTGKPTAIYRGPSSENDIISVSILDPGNGTPMCVEYSINAVFPDLDYRDSEEIAEEIYAFIARWNADTIFGANGDVVEVAA